MSCLCHISWLLEGHQWLANQIRNRQLSLLLLMQTAAVLISDWHDLLRQSCNLTKNVLHVQSQDVAGAFGAVCTPEFFLFKKVGDF